MSADPSVMMVADMGLPVARCSMTRYQGLEQRSARLPRGQARTRASLAVSGVTLHARARLRFRTTGAHRKSGSGTPADTNAASSGELSGGDVASDVVVPFELEELGTGDPTDVLGQGA